MSDLLTSTSPAPTLSDAVRSEFTKLVSVRSQRWLLIATVPIAALVAAVCGTTLPQSTGRSLDMFSPGEQISAFLYGVYAATIVTFVVGTLYVGVEYSNKLSVTTFAITPRRDRILVAKVIVMAAVGSAVGLITSLVCTATAMGLTPGGLDMSEGGLARTAFWFSLQPVFYGVLAVLATFAFRSTTFGILTVVGVFAVLPALARAVPESVDAVIKPFMPVAALHSIAGATLPGSTEDLPVWLAIVVLVVWSVIAFFVAQNRLRSKDA